MTLKVNEPQTYKPAPDVLASLGLLLEA